ncbi:hypothetical protein ACWCOW_38545, partial [Streptomyces sp. NPDC001939]
MNSESILFPPPDPRVTELARRCLEDIDSLVGLWVECVRPVRTWSCSPLNCLSSASKSVQTSR